MKDDLLLDRHLPEIGESKMNDNHARPNLIDTTDCLEAVEIFKGWKNLFFVIILICLLMLQGVFWLVDIGFVKSHGEKAQAGVVENVRNVDTSGPAVAAEQIEEEATEIAENETDNILDDLKAAGFEVSEDITRAAKNVVAEPGQADSTEDAVAEKGFDVPVKVSADQIRKALMFINFVLIIAAILYCLTLLFTLKVSLLGRLGGINHISRAFFCSFFMCVFLLPWQNMFGSFVSGYIFSSQTLMESYLECKSAGVFSTSLYYLRFVGYWVWVFLLLICSQLRSRRWARAILRRLDVI